MRKFLATTLIVLACVALPMIFTQTDPGVKGNSGLAVADTIVVCDTCPPVPDGFQGQWLPPDVYTTSSTDSTGASPPWEDPDH